MHTGTRRPVCTACGFVYFADPKVTVAVLVVRAGCVLLGKRGVEPQRGLWCLPGGFMDYGERVHEAAAREVLEETGLRVQVGPLLGVWDFEAHIGGKQGIALLFRGQAAEGDPVAGDDMEAIGWFAPDTLPPIAFPIHQKVIQEWIDGLGYQGEELP